MDNRFLRAFAICEQLEPRRLLSGGQLDLVDNALIATGRNGGIWNGSGIITSQTDATPGAISTTIFGGQSASSGDALVMYTYGGDANLSGQVDADDYFSIDKNYMGNGAFGWFTGDFNYNGVTGISESPHDFSGTNGNDRISVFRRDGVVVISINGTESTTQSPELRIYGKGGNDKIVIELGDYADDLKITIDGGAGNDTIWSGAGGERIYGGGGNDLIYGNGGRDTIYGEAGDDFIRGGGGSDLLDGGDGYDTIFGDAGNDNISGGAQPDWLRGGDGNDRIEGNGGRDHLAGEAGDDSLFGGAGADVLHGGAGRDLLRGGADFDQIYRDNDDELLPSEVDEWMPI